MAIDGIGTGGTQGPKRPDPRKETQTLRNWGMTEAIRETGWKGGEAVDEKPLHDWGLVEQEHAAASSAPTAPPEPTIVPAAAALTPAPPTKDRFDRLTALRVNAVLDAARTASGEIDGVDAAVIGALDKLEAPPPPPPPPPKKKKRKKKRGFLKKLGRKIKATVKKAGRALAKIGKGVVRFAKGAVKATFSVAKTMFKTTLNLAKTALRAGGKLLTGDFKGAWSASKDGLKETGKDIVRGAKEAWSHTKEALKGIGEVVTGAISLAEATVPGFKVVTDFMKTKLGQKILMALAIVSMIPPLTVIAPAMMAIALYQGASMMGQGLETGDFKKAAMGALTAASSYLGLKGVGGGAGAAAGSTAQKSLNIASNSLKAVDAIERHDWKGALMAGASAGAAAGGNATAQQVVNLTTKGVAAAEAAKNKDWLAVGAAAVTVGAAGMALAAMDTDDSKPKTGIAKAWDDTKKWVGEKWDAFKETPAGKVVMAPVNLVKTGIDKTDQYLFGTKLPGGTRAPDGLVTKVGDWWSDNVQKPVANFFTPIKNTLSGVRDGIDEGVGALKQPLEAAAGGVDKAAYGEDGESGAFGALKGGVAKAFDPVKDAADAGAAAVRDGASDLVGKAGAALGSEPVVATGPAVPGSDGMTPAPLGAPGQEAATQVPGAAAGALGYVAGKLDTAMTNANNLAGKVDAVAQDVGQVHDDLATKLEAINRAHDTFMSGVDTVRAVQDGDAIRALRSGGVVMNAAGYTELGAGMQDLAYKADATKAAKKAVEDGDVGTALYAAGQLAGLQDLSDTGEKILEARRFERAIEHGDVADAIYEAGRFTGSRETQDVGERLYEAQAAKEALDRGDQASALAYGGRALGSRAVESTGETLRDAQTAQQYAEDGQIGSAMYMAGRATGNADMMDVGNRVDATETAAAALQGQDRYGNKLDGVDATARFLDASGRATDSQELRTGGYLVDRADAMNRALDAGDQASADRAAGDIAGATGRQHAEDNLYRMADELDKRLFQANLIGGAAEDGRLGDLTDDIAATQGMKAQQVEASRDAKEFEKNAQSVGGALSKVEKLGKKLT